MELEIELNIEKGEFLYKKSDYFFRYNSREAAHIKLLEMFNGGYAYEIEVILDVPETYKKFTSAHTYDEQFYKGVYEMGIVKQIILKSESEALQHATAILRAIFEKFVR